VNGLHDGKLNQIKAESGVPVSRWNRIRESADSCSTRRRGRKEEYLIKTSVLWANSCEQSKLKNENPTSDKVVEPHQPNGAMPFAGVT